MDWGILLGIIGVLGIPLALASLGLTMATTTPGEFRFVRSCFYVAAAICTITTFASLWNYTEGSEAMRVLAAGVVGALMFAGMALALDWINKKQEGVNLATSANSSPPPAAPSPARTPPTLPQAPVQTEHERQQKLLDKLTAQLIAERPELANNPDGALAWLNAQLEARGENFRWGRMPPTGLSNMTIIGNDKGGTFMKSDGTAVSNENLVIKGFGTVFDVKGGSLTNKNVEAVAPSSKQPTERKK